MENILGKIMIPIIAILIARTVPDGIIGIVLVSILLSFIVIGRNSYGLLLVVFIIPIIVSLFITPECITPLHTRNREYYGSTFNVCKYLHPIENNIPKLRLLGEFIFIGSILLFSLKSGMLFRAIGGLIGITFILIEMMFVHPVPLLEREYIQWKLQPNPLK